MSGIALAVAAGIGFGLFQAVNRRANHGIDPYQATFGLLSIGSLGLLLVIVVRGELHVIGQTPPRSFVYFAAAGIVHFLVGWTFLALSQQRIGAARTGATVAATPLVGSVLAALVLREPLGPVTAVGVVLVVVGLAVLSWRAEDAGTTGRRALPWFGLVAATAWGTSPIFIRWGLEGLPVPLVGVAIGIVGATLSYGVVLVAGGRRRSPPLVRSNLPWMVGAGALAAAAITAQWMSYDLIPIAVAITLMQVSAPVVILAAPLIVGTRVERLSFAVLGGAGLIVAGSVVVVLSA